MNHRIARVWDEPLWRLAEPVYHEAFPPHGRKPEAVVRSSIERGVAALHVGLSDEGRTDAMALTSVSEDGRAFLIDYLAVRQAVRGRGVGRAFCMSLAAWAEAETDARGVVIEVEAAPGVENESRVRFWSSCGFVLLSEYEHRYIWVPETYYAMVRPLAGRKPLPADGKALFRYITEYHRRAYRGR